MSENCFENYDKLTPRQWFKINKKEHGSGTHYATRKQRIRSLRLFERRIEKELKDFDSITYLL